MANRSLFRSLRRAARSRRPTRPQRSGRPAYALDAEAGARAVRRDRLPQPHLLRRPPRRSSTRVLELAAAVSSPSSSRRPRSTRRERGFMKDMPALLCAVLAARDVGAA